MSADLSHSQPPGLRVYFTENGVQRRQAYSRFAGRSLSEEQQAALDAAVSDEETEERRKTKQPSAVATTLRHTSGDPVVSYYDIPEGNSSADAVYKGTSDRRKSGPE